MNYWLYPFAIFLGGMVFKWALDLFFLRRVYHEIEQRLNLREAEFTTLKHEHSRSLSELKNKLTELDATTKAKLLAEGNLAKLNANLESLRAHLLRTEEDLASTRAREATLEERVGTRERELQFANARIDTLQAESRDHAGAAESLRARLAEVTVEASTHAEAAAGGRAQLATVHQEAAAALARATECEGALTAQQSVTATLEAALHSRDASIVDWESRYAALDAERQSIGTSLGVADREISTVRAEITDLSRRLEDVRRTSTDQELELRSLRTQYEKANRACEAAEALAKQRESEIAVVERRLADVQQLAEATEAGNRRLLAEVATTRREGVSAGTQQVELQRKLRAAEEAAREHDRQAGEWTARCRELESERDTLRAQVEEVRTAAAPPVAALMASTVPVISPAALEPDTGLAQRVRDAEAELEAVSQSHARLESALAQERRRSAELEDQLLTADRAADPAAVKREAALLAEIDEINRERNALAAELAALKNSQPAAPPTPSRKRKPKPPQVDLFAGTPAPEAAVAVEPAAQPLANPAVPAAGEAVTEFSTQCPQHLSDVQGIGPVFETRLYEAGVGSYWELSQLSDGSLAEVLELDDRQRDQFDFAATRSDAIRLAEETRSVGRKWTGELPDDLEPLEGIGPVIEKRLYDAGICTYKALAAANLEHLVELCPPAKFRGANHAHWIEQARQRLGAEEN